MSNRRKKMTKIVEQVSVQLQSHIRGTMFSTVLIPNSKVQSKCLANLQKWIIIAPPEVGRKPTEVEIRNRQKGIPYTVKSGLVEVEEEDNTLMSVKGCGGIETGAWRD
jgi:hypothetical protein